MRAIASFVLLVIIAYGAFTAYAGFRVARGIDDAKAASWKTRVGARLAGRDRVERIAIAKSHLPDWITGSPAFWYALRKYE